MSGAAGAFGAFASGLAGSYERKQDREYRKERDAKLDEYMARREGLVTPEPVSLGVDGAAPVLASASPAPVTATTIPAAPGGRSGPSASFQGGGNKDAFIEAMMPHALRVSEATGLDPRLVIAQAAQETGWGRSAPGNNFFGIKSHGRKGGSNLATQEVINGQRVTVRDSFRGYADMGESADDYAAFLKSNPRYSDMLAAKDLDGQIAALGRSGYATDPNYARSVASIANSIPMPARPMAPPEAITVETLKNRWPRPLGVGGPT